MIGNLKNVDSDNLHWILTDFIKDKLIMAKWVEPDTYNVLFWGDAEQDVRDMMNRIDTSTKIRSQLQELYNDN